MIHRFEDLKNLYKEAASIRYVGGETAADAEFDLSDESDPRNEFLASASREEIMQLLELSLECPQSMWCRPVQKAGTYEGPYYS